MPKIESLSKNQTSQQWKISAYFDIYQNLTFGIKTTLPEKRNVTH